MLAATIEREPQIIQTEHQYIALDAIPLLKEARDQVRAEARAVIESRRSIQGDQDVFPLPIDALSTAEKVIQAAADFGEGSHQHNETSDELRLDMSRLVAEWYRKLKPEYFEPVRHVYDEMTGDFYSHGLSVRQMTENALTPIIDDPEEVDRRVNERVEDATPRIIRRLGGVALGASRIRTISQCTDKAISDYQSDLKAGRSTGGYKGYVPEIEKVMIRDVRIDQESGDRLVEQIGLPGMYINKDIFSLALARRQLDIEHMNKTELHGTQLLVRDDLIEFVELLDEVASEEWCVNIFMGEQVPDDFVKDYSAIRHEAKKRQAGLKNMADTAALYVMDLATAGTDKRLAPAMVEKFVKKMLLNMARQNHSLAAQMFGEKTALGLREVARLESMGEYEEAFLKFQQVEATAPGGGYCGAGSCGLESVMPGSDEEKAIKKLGFNSKDSLLDKGDRQCPKCKTKTVVYDTKQAKKGCIGCQATASY